MIGGDGEKQQRQKFPQEIIDKKYIFLRILAQKYMSKEEKKKFPPYMYKKKSDMHLLKSPLPHIHPHRPFPPSLF